MAEIKFDPFALEAPLNDAGEVRVFARERLLSDIDHRDLAAQSSKGLSHFQTDRSRPQYQQVRYRLAQVEYAFVGQIRYLFETRHRRKHRPLPAGPHATTRVQYPDGD